MTNNGTFQGQVIVAPQFASGALGSQDISDVVFTISCQRDPRPNGQLSQYCDTIPCICKGYMAERARVITINSMVIVSGRVETGQENGRDFMALNVSKIYVL